MEEKNKSNILTKKRSLWAGWFIVAGLVYYLGNKNFGTTSIDKFIVMVIAIMAGIAYYHIVKKRRIRLVKNDVVEKILDAIIVILGSAFLIGFLTTMF